MHIYKDALLLHPGQSFVGTSTVLDEKTAEDLYRLKKEVLFRTDEIHTILSFILQVISYLFHKKKLQIHLI